jgi:hypothetical protein
MPWCECHSFASLESETAPIISHADVAELVLISTLESISPNTHRSDEERKLVHDKLMRLQEEFLRKIGERLRVYRDTLRSEWIKSQRESSKFE